MADEVTNPSVNQWGICISCLREYREGPEAFQ